jgi:aromatic-L-amino-acid/L-tryptophan decarboxylase
MRDDLVVYASDQSHSSVARAARTLGFRPEQLRVLPVDDEFRMPPDALAGAMATDREAGRRPLIVCASAGSTNTGAIDPLDELADACRANDTWLHVDGAYGGFAALTERGKRWLAGIERADSITLDPDKWLYQPFECGCVLVREGRLLEDAFRIAPDYLKDARGAEVDFADRGLQLSRMARSLKLWLSIQTFGVGAFREAIERALDLAELAEHLVGESEELELLRPARLGIVCFRRRFGGERSEAETEALNRRLVSALEQSGEGLVSSTRLRGRYAIRLCATRAPNATSGTSSIGSSGRRSISRPQPPRPSTCRSRRRTDTSRSSSVATRSIESSPASCAHSRSSTAWTTARSSCSPGQHGRSRSRRMRRSPPAGVGDETSTSFSRVRRAPRSMARWCGL